MPVRFQVDSDFYDHPKTIGMSDAAVALWTRAGSYSAAKLTDGFIAEHVLALLSRSPEEACEELVSRGLWRRTKDGFKFHQWDHRNLTKSRVEAEREDARTRKRKQRGKNDTSANAQVSPEIVPPGVTGGVTRDSHGSHSGVTDLSVSVSLSESELSTSEVDDAPSDADFESDDVPPIEPREDVERVCRHLQQRMVENGYVKPAITNRWREAARLLLDRDKRTEAQVIAAIDWAQNHEFWRANIKSLPKLRTQYDTLRLQASARGGKSNVTPVDFGAQPKDPKDRPLYAADDVRARWTK
jgi:hypothetical protein